MEGVKKIYLYAPDDPLCLEPEPTYVDPTAVNQENSQPLLYHVVIDLYAYQLLDVVNNKINPEGPPLIVPKDKNGYPIDENQIMNFRIDMDPTTEDVEELKEWMALLSYLKANFPAYVENDPGPGIPSAIYGQDGAVEERIEFGTFDYESDY